MTYCVCIPLTLTEDDRNYLNKSFETARGIYNKVLAELFRRDRCRKNTPEWSQIRKNSESGNKSKNKPLFKILDEQWPMTPYSMQTEITSGIVKTWVGHHLDASVVQTITKHAAETFKEYSVGTRGKPKFKGFNTYNLIRSQHWTNPLRLNKERTQVVWRNRSFKLNIKELSKTRQPLAIQALKDAEIEGNLRYIAIHRSGNFYKVILTMKGDPEKRINHQSQKIIGLDLGVRNVAYVSDDKQIKIPFSKELKDIEKEILKLQKALSRSDRLNNPQCYDENGATIKGKRIIHTQNAIKLIKKINTLKRKQRYHRKHLHNRIVNEVVSNASKIITEDVSSKEWQEYFGKSISHFAPGMFLAELKRKCETYNVELVLLNPYDYPLTQLCHCGNKEKKTLRQRQHTCNTCGCDMDRDIHSAAMCYALGHIDNCDLDFEKLTDIIDKIFEKSIVSV